MNGRFWVALAAFILAVCGTSYGQRRRGGISRRDEIMYNATIPKTPAPAPERKIDPSKLHPLTENTYRNPKVLDENSNAVIVEVDNLKYSLNKQKGEGTVIGVADAKCYSLTEAKIWESILYNDFVYPVTIIGINAFHQETIAKISIPNTIKSIDSTAFAYSDLSEVHIPASVKTIHQSSFQGSKICSVVFEEGLKDIGSYAFMGCKKLESVTLPRSVTRIKREAFSGCTALKSAVLPAGLAIITEGLFCNCPALTTLTFPTALTTIQASAFRCAGLINVTLPVGLTTIGQSAFEDSKIQTLSIPSTVTKIEWLAFNNCTKLRKIVMPKSLRDIRMLVSVFDDPTHRLFCNTDDLDKWTAFTWVD